MKSKNKNKQGGGKSAVEMVLKDLNSNLQEYLAALKAVNDNNEYHNMIR